MIAEFTIKNFLSIRTEQKLSFEPTSDTYMNDTYCYEVKEGIKLLKIGIIYGANASGKTNVLMALSFFKKLMTIVPNDKNNVINFEPFLLDDNSRKELTEITMSFYLKKEKYKLSVILDKNKIHSETLQVYPTIQPALIYHRKYNEDTDSTIVEFGSKSELSKTDQQSIRGNTINNCSVIAAFGKSNVEISRLNDIYAFFSNGIDNVIYPKSSLSLYAKEQLRKDSDGTLKKFITNFFKISDFNIEDIELISNEIPIIPEVRKLLESISIPNEITENVLKKGIISNYEIMFKHKTDCGTFNLTEKQQSTGTLRFMGLSVVLKRLLLNSHIIPIDEIESSIHYELLSYFIKVFLVNSKSSAQLLITTHDINLLNEDFIRQDTIWFADKQMSGETELVRLSSLGLSKKVSPYNAYKQNKLVDLPFLGSIFLDLDN